MSDKKTEKWAKPESVNLPSELRIAKFAEARIKEITKLTGFISKRLFLFYNIHAVAIYITKNSAPAFFRPSIKPFQLDSKKFQKNRHQNY